MITLYQPPPAWGLPSISPFCVKLETYLRMTKIDYKTRGSDIFKAPKGRSPYISLDGEMIGDSTLIIQKLKERFGDPLDGGLSREKKTQAVLLQRLVEDHLLPNVAWLRWSNENSFRYLYDYFKALMPPVMGRLIVPLIRKGMLKNMRTHGVGDHTQQEIVDFAFTDLEAIANSLGDKKFFLGDEPTSIDAVMYGFLIQLMWVPWDCPVKKQALAQKNLVEFCERMKQRYWS
jgi:glutathione S-transferase